MRSGPHFREAISNLRLVDALDGVGIERNEVLRFQRGGVLRLVIELRPVGEEGGAAVRTTEVFAFSGRRCSALLDDDVCAGRGGAFRERREKTGSADLRLDPSDRLKREAALRELRARAAVERARDRGN